MPSNTVAWVSLVTTGSEFTFPVPSRGESMGVTLSAHRTLHALSGLKYLYVPRTELRPLRRLRKWHQSREGSDLRQPYPRGGHTQHRRLGGQLDAQKLHLADDVRPGLLRHRDDVDG